MNISSDIFIAFQIFFVWNWTKSTQNTVVAAILVSLIDFLTTSDVPHKMPTKLDCRLRLFLPNQQNTFAQLTKRIVFAFFFHSLGSENLIGFFERKTIQCKWACFSPARATHTTVTNTHNFRFKTISTLLNRRSIFIHRLEWNKWKTAHCYHLVISAFTLYVCLRYRN